ncbi:putative bolA-like protein C4B3.11c [Hypsizygus marmoreus]|uniref:BolA-like protein C4B3.11c n=1 Tax=Hypsizygus marmoreus TaxID=39966 RepID=A0A369JRS1_HYPMA|nr:putative bolA-like protein C4B3.11c [Hypsizygus marmoreus]
MLSLAARRLARPPPSHVVRAFTASAARCTPSLSDGEQTIHDKLTAKFAPSQLKVQDVSGGCGSFYAITIASEAFSGLSIVKQHKLVTETLKQEIEGIHGLQIKTIPQ